MSKTQTPALIPNPSRLSRATARPNIGILLRGPKVPKRSCAALADELAEAGFDDIRPPIQRCSNTSRADGSRLSKLAQRAQLTKQSMGYLVDYLEGRGYVERRPDPPTGERVLSS